jgi:superfamily II DNA or RNA helicase
MPVYFSYSQYFPILGPSILLPFDPTSGHLCKKENEPFTVKNTTHSKTKTKKIPRTRKPENMALAEWQTALRRQYGREAQYKLKNFGQEPVFSDFEITNPDSRSTYRVAIRGSQLGDNFCACPDYAINTLGTCKHIEFVLGKLENKRGGKATLQKGYHQPFSEVYLRYGVQRAVAFKAGANCPPSLKTLATRYFDGQGVLKPEAFRRFPEFVKKAQATSHEVRLYEDALRFVAQVRDKTSLAERVDTLMPQGPSSPLFEKLLSVPLYPYQQEGALFAAKAGRCLLADDMGLGKTLQALAATELLAQAVGVERVLVVAPTSLKHQWKQEIARFTTRTVEVTEGFLPQRTAAYNRSSFFIITNYDVVHRDMEAIRAWGADLIILDEAQRIKNWKTRTAQTIKQLASEYAIVLTGTPLENRLEELHSLVEFVDRFHLGPRFQFLAEHQHVDDNGRVIGYRNLSHIALTLKPILLRRTKKEVLEHLPERMEKQLFLGMTPEQWTHHEDNRETVTRIVAKWRRMGFLPEQDQRLLMIALQNMRMSCNSTYLLDPTTEHSTKPDEFMALIKEILEQPEAKVVVFSQWVRTLELLAKRLKARRHQFVLFHGRIPGKQRPHLIQTFREDPACRIFLSTDAGGVGLNLQHATAVCNMDLPWNPAVLEQRIGRVHRLGQHRPVQVYHFIAEHTIEHGMLELLAFKQSLFAGVLEEGQEEVFLGGTRLKRFMDSVDKATSAIPEGRKSFVAKPTKGFQPHDPSLSPEQEVWTTLIQAGQALFNGLAASMPAAAAETRTKTSPAIVAALDSKKTKTLESPTSNFPSPPATPSKPSPKS